MFTAIINLRVNFKQAFPVYKKVAPSICPILVENVMKGSQFCCPITSLHEYEYFQNFLKKDLWLQQQIAAKSFWICQHKCLSSATFSR